MSICVRVEQADFNLGAEYDALIHDRKDIGAVVQFVGRVRDLNLGDSVTGLTLSHYPGMTERLIAEICEHATSQWQLLGSRVVHRVGSLHAGDQIVLVSVAAAHRGAAFSGCEYIMDALKTQAMFWKKEQYNQGSRWLEQREDDIQRAQRW